VERFISRNSALRRSGMTSVNEESQNLTCHPHVYPQLEWATPAFSPQPQSAAALWPVLISRPAEDRRLSWPGWLGEILRWFARPKTVTHPSISRGGRESNSRPSSCQSNALTTWLPSHPWSATRCCMPSAEAVRFYSLNSEQGRCRAGVRHRRPSGAECVFVKRTAWTLMHTYTYNVHRSRAQRPEPEAMARPWRKHDWVTRWNTKARCPRSQYDVDVPYCYRPSSVVCQSLCQSFTIVNAAKTSEPIDISFRLWSLVGPRNHLFNGVKIAHTKGNFEAHCKL